MLLARVRDAAVEAVLAGALVGVVEATRVVVSAGSGAVSWFVIAGVAALGAIGIAFALRAVLAAVRRLPTVDRWSSDLGGTGTARTVAAWRTLLIVVTVVVFGVVAYQIGGRVHVTYRFNDADPVGMLLAVALTPLAALFVAAAVFLDRIVAPRLPDVLGGSRVWIAAAVALLGLVGGPTLLVHLAVPAHTSTGIFTGSIAFAAVLAAMIARPGRSRIAQIVAAVVIVAGGVATWALAAAPRARGAIVVQGVASRAIAKAVWSLADGDGDGYAGAGVGGADCDDGDAMRSPRALDVPGNGIDENCSGADATASEQRTRTPAAPMDVPPLHLRSNIVVISVDALRADHLGAYGYGRPTSPMIDALAKTSVRFDRAYTSCPSTRCAIPSLLTGRYASTVRGEASVDEVPSLARVFRQAGYVTTAITCCDRFSLGKRELEGFGSIDASADDVRMRRAGQSNGDVVADTALAWLKNRNPYVPYFMWLHFYEPHYPYAAPEGPDFGDDDVDRYDTEIHYVDKQIGRVLGGLDESAIVVITADHGDEFGEHGIRFHARSLYNQVVRVPLIIKAPRIAPRVIDTPVSIVDIAPTLLEMSFVQQPAGMNGVSLVPGLRGGDVPTRPVFIELIPDAQIKRDMAAIVSAPWKVIWDREANAWSLFDLGDAADAVDRADDPALPTLQKLLRETLDKETSRLP